MTAVPTEHQEQAALFEWAARYKSRYVMYEIPNGVKRAIQTAAMLKAGAERGATGDNPVVVA